MKRVFCLAGNMAQSEYWRRMGGFSKAEWVYLSDPRQLAGTQAPEYFRVGTWYEVRAGKLEAIEQQLAVCGAVEVEMPKLRPL